MGINPDTIKEFKIKDPETGQIFKVDLTVREIINIRLMQDLIFAVRRMR